MGRHRDDLLDSLGHPSASEQAPELQSLKIGQRVPWAKPDSTWAWVLADLPGRRTRLVTRVHARYDWAHPVTQLSECC